MIDMEAEFLEELLDYMEDGNGADPPEAGNAKKRYQVQATLFKVLYTHAKLQGDKLDEIGTKLDRVITEMDEHPTIQTLISKKPIKAGSITVGFFMFMLGLWFALYGLATTDGVQAWFEKLLG